MTYPELLIYWIKERYEVFERKEKGVAKPWSEDYIFQETYFCNVHRENDRVTRWVRNFYGRHVQDPFFEYNIVLSRFINRPKTLDALGYQRSYDPEGIERVLADMPKDEPIWGSAYIITTHGQRMGKVEYLTRQVLSDVAKSLERLQTACHKGLCCYASDALQRIDGIGSFLAGQVVADLKNTVGHPLYVADDRWAFVEPGPGSLRGVAWFLYGATYAGGISVSKFQQEFKKVREYVDANWPEGVPRVDNQDLQNCLCEYDKYCRIRTHTGRSKRKYNGS